MGRRIRIGRYVDMEEPHIARGKRILVAEDEQIVRECIYLLLKRDGHIVTEAEDGVKALDLFRAGNFDLVITDLLMPGMRGDELAARIKDLAPSQPVVMVTAFAEELPAGHMVDAVVEKPFSIAGLRQTIGKVLSSTPVVSTDRAP